MHISESPIAQELTTSAERKRRACCEGRWAARAHKQGVRTAEFDIEKAGHDGADTVEQHIVHNQNDQERGSGIGQPVPFPLKECLHQQGRRQADNLKAMT